MEKRNFLTLPGLELRPLGRPAHSQSLYRPWYPGSLIIGNMGGKENNKKMEMGMYRTIIKEKETVSSWCF
jgi:hypothetical protein